MIQTVRISQAEQWCDKAKKFAETNPGFIKIAGLPVEIMTESVRPNRAGCNSPRQWRVPDEIGKQHFEIAGIPYNPDAQFWICEHMLEMD